MKKKCKHIDITDWKTVQPWVTDCVMRHKKRYDFKKMLLEHGLTKQEYSYAISNQDYKIFDRAIIEIAKDACERIKNRKLNLPPVVIGNKIDHTSGKERQIGKEVAMQQVLDHIAVHSCDEIFHSRMVKQQMSSIAGRGQIKGVKLIRKYIQKDNDAIRYAHEHERFARYSSRCKYHVKLDIKKCYPSARLEIFMKILEHDCGNQDILWLWRTLLSSHRVGEYQGFMIGALPSQWACQVMLSFIYRKAMELYSIRRGKKVKKVSHMVMFMDDMLLMGSNRKQLLSAVKEIVKFAKDELGFDIKPNYEIKNLDLEPIDMMGFTIFRNGKVRMRARNFIHSRRIMLRIKATGRATLSQAKRLLSYKGFWKYSDTLVTTKKYKTHSMFDKCAKIISFHDKEVNNAVHNRIFGGTGCDAKLLSA